MFCTLLKNDPQHKYYVNDGDGAREIDVSIAEKDLGIIIDLNLSFDTHIDDEKSACYN